MHMGQQSAIILSPALMWVMSPSPGPDLPQTMQFFSQFLMSTFSSSLIGYSRLLCAFRLAEDRETPRAPGSVTRSSRQALPMNGHTTPVGAVQSDELDAAQCAWSKSVGRRRLRESREPHIAWKRSRRRDDSKNSCDKNARRCDLHRNYRIALLAFCDRATRLLMSTTTRAGDPLLLPAHFA